MVRELNLPWMEAAKSYIGVREIPGPKSNPKIIKWAENVGGWTEDYYTNDDIPWCGLFVAECMFEAQIPITIKNPLSAREWAKFGVPVQPSYGAILVFSRNGGGHVGFYVSEDADTYHVLGGNQSNMVNITRVAKSRHIATRFPKEYEDFYIFNPQTVDLDDLEDASVSSNEE